MSVSIQVLSRREGTFSVTCTASGGTVLTSYFSGPGVMNSELQPVGTVGRTGQNTYSVTSDTISGRSNGDTYLCTATNGVTSPAPSDSAVLAGIVYACTVGVMWLQTNLHVLGTLNICEFMVFHSISKCLVREGIIGASLSEPVQLVHCLYIYMYNIV